MQDLELPPIDYGAIAPMLILFGVACVGVFFEAVLPRSARRSTQLVLALLGLVAAFVWIVVESDTRILTAGGAVAIDGPTLFLQGAIILLGLMALLLVGDRSLEQGGAFVAQAAITVGSITSSIGFGNSPRNKISSTSGASATRSRRVTSEISCTDGPSGPVIVRWYMIRM